MNICIISMYYHPEPVARPHDLACILRQYGHEVRVITTLPNYPHGKIYSNYRQKLFRWEKIEGIDVFRIPNIISRSRSKLLRIISYSSFTINAIIFGSMVIKDIDAIWTYQIGLPGLIVAKWLCVPSIHEVQDLWPDWGVASGMIHQKWIFHILNNQEKLLYKHSKKIVTITRSFRNKLIQKGVQSDKIEIISNWANDRNFHAAAYDYKLAKMEGLSDYFNITYIGNIGAAQSLDVIMEAAHLLADIKDLQFVIIGDGVEKPRLEKKANEYRLKNVLFLGSRPQEKAALYMAMSDILFIHLKRDPIYEITIPSKTFGYLASGKPILAAAEGELAELIQRTKSGLVCKPEDATGLAETARQFRKMTKKQRTAMGDAGIKAINNFYSKKSLGKLYNHLFIDITKRHYPEL